MQRQTPDDVALVPLRDDHAPGLSRFLRAHGADRSLTDHRALSDSPQQDLLGRLLGDAARHDAVAIVALRAQEVAGVVVLRFPRWDAEHFGFVVARVEHLQGSDERVLQYLTDEAVRRVHAHDARLCSARLSNDALPALHCQERAGFRYVELMLAPWRDLTTWQHKGFGVTRPMVTGDLDRVCAVARAAFRTDRFHRDRRFDRAAADGVYEKWVRSWHGKPSPSRFSRVLTVDGDVAGFFMFELTTPAAEPAGTVARIVLNGIEPSVAGRGHGYRMYCDALDAASRVARYATADVAAANPAVVNLYAKLGFHLSGSGEVTMHRWA
jgi:ribosomal protein S18 acetylase RimI-like enzyme